MDVEAEAPIIENPFGVHDHDVLCGRGAYVNGHTGNARLRKLATERKAAFDKGNFTDKRTLATEVVQAIRGLNPPGRFLKKANTGKDAKSGDEPTAELVDGMWEELTDEKAIHKACQVMRDIARPDRKFREERKANLKAAKLAKAAEREGKVTIIVGAKREEPPKDEETLAAEQAAVEVVDKALAHTDAVDSTEAVEI
ncbi:MAG: hypothetical protein SGARI_004283 [Bacillariaceae sp.]